VYTDHVNLRGVDLSATIEAATSLTPDFSDRVIDGIVGLSLHTNNVFPTLKLTIVHHLINAFNLKLPVFAARLPFPRGLEFLHAWLYQRNARRRD
jgi:hypothetical protein